MLKRDAANETQGTSLLFHAGNVVVNAGIFFIIGAGFGHWTSATISLLTCIATGEIMIFTQPTGAVDTLRQYRNGDFAPSRSFSSNALDLAARYGLSAYDALYACLAHFLKTTLVTCDVRLIRALAGSAISLSDPVAALRLFEPPA